MFREKLLALMAKWRVWTRGRGLWDVASVVTGHRCNALRLTAGKHTEREVGEKEVDVGGSIRSWLSSTSHGGKHDNCPHLGQPLTCSPAGSLCCNTLKGHMMAKQPQQSPAGRCENRWVAHPFLCVNLHTHPFGKSLMVQLIFMELLLQAGSWHDHCEQDPFLQGAVKIWGPQV